MTKRFKSFLWRLGMVIVAVVLDFTAKNLADFELNDSITLVLGLMLGELSKFISNVKMGKVAGFRK